MNPASETASLFRIASQPDDIIKALLVRAIVFMEEQNISYAEEMDAYDREALQIIGEIQDEPIATARIRFLGDTAKLERLAIRKAWRNQGHGDRLIEFMLSTSRERGFRKFKLHAQARLRAFYEKHGFQAEGEPFLEAGIPHLLMWKHDPEP